MGNEVLAQILRDLVSRCSLIALMYQRASAAEHSQEEHVEIVEALAAKDEDARRAADGRAPASTSRKPAPSTAGAHAATSPCALVVNATMTYDSTAPYPRDLAGYGRNPPHARWPGDARIARAVRPELRGRRRELRAARRRRLASSSCPRCSTPPAFPARHLSMEGDLRVRLARRRLAHPARVRAARPAAHGVRRRHGAASAIPNSPPPSSNWATRSPATAGAGSTTRTSTRPPSASTCAWRMADHRAADRRARRSAGTPAATARTRAAWWPTTAASSTTATTTATTCRSGCRCSKTRRRARAAPGRALHARLPTTCASRCRRASRTATTSSATCATASTCSTPKATRRPKMMSIGMHCRLLGRPGPHRARCSASSTTCSSTTASGSAAASTSRATGSTTHPFDRDRVV